MVARSDQGELPIKRERVDLDELLSRVGARFTRRASERAEIVVDVPAALEADVDILRVEQALGNLIDNALRYGAGDVRVSARRDDGSVSFEVSDHGAGFPPGFESQAFERFTRADGGRTSEGPASASRSCRQSPRRTADARRSRAPASPRPWCISMPLS